MNAASLGTYSSWSVHTSTPVPLKRHGVQGRSGSQASNGQSAGQSEPPGSFQPHHLSHLFLCTVSVAPRLQWTGKRLLEVLSYGGDTFLICNGQFAAEMTPVWSSRRHEMHAAESACLLPVADDDGVRNNVIVSYDEMLGNVARQTSRFDFTTTDSSCLLSLLPGLYHQGVLERWQHGGHLQTLQQVLWPAGEFADASQVGHLEPWAGDC